MVNMNLMDDSMVTIRVGSSNVHLHSDISGRSQVSVSLGGEDGGGGVSGWGRTASLTGRSTGLTGWSAGVAWCAVGLAWRSTGLTRWDANIGGAGGRSGSGKDECLILDRDHHCWLIISIDPVNLGKETKGATQKHAGQQLHSAGQGS